MKRNLAHSDATFGSVFSGCGAMDLGFQNAGWSCKWQIEKDESCQELLKRRFPEAELFGDVRTVDAESLPWVRTIIGGVPCTDLSVSMNGSGQNLDGAESGLIRDFARIVQQVKPTYFVIENVAKLLSLWGTVEDMGLFDGYETEAKILDGSDFGAYTRRKRAFIVGHIGKRSGREILDFTGRNQPAFRTGGHEDVLPMCLPWKGGVSLERLGACVVTVDSSAENDTTRTGEGDGIARQLDSGIPRQCTLPYDW